MAATSDTITETATGYRYLTLHGTHDLFRLQQYRPQRYPYFLESAARGKNGRYDLLFAFPGKQLILHGGGRLEIDRQHTPGRFLDILRQKIETDHVSSQHNGSLPLPFAGGWFVYLGYELVKEIEPTLAGLPEDHALPRAVATRIPAVIGVDHQTGTTSLITDPVSDPELIDKLYRDLTDSRKQEVQKKTFNMQVIEDDPANYLNGIVRVQKYIREGDVFQVNLSRGWRTKLEDGISPHMLYDRLRHSNPAPFAGLALIDKNKAIISSSPERLVRTLGNKVFTRPIAGTHPRGRDARQDRVQSQALLRHPKEQAEHIMLIDLERNDLGRVCIPGTVKAEELMTLESYTHVHHIVSEVTGTLRSGINPVDVICAVFPGGTITGCPKVRCMEIIQELEHVARGAYTGSMGYINLDGSMDLNILIRTLVYDGDAITLRAGAGIVADSVPERELDETRAKAEGLLRALGVT